MDQRHGVDHFQRHRRGQGLRRFPARQLAGGKAENRAQALATGKQRIAHRFPEGLRPLRTERSIEGRFHLLFGLAEIGLEIELGAHGWTLAGGILSGRALSCRGEPNPSDGVFASRVPCPVPW